jgi:hypothetical protein
LSFPVRKGHSSPFQHPLAIKARLNNAIDSSIHLFSRVAQIDMYQVAGARAISITLISGAKQVNAAIDSIAYYVAGDALVRR